VTCLTGRLHQFDIENYIENTDLVGNKDCLESVDSLVYHISTIIYGQLYCG